MTARNEKNRLRAKKCTERPSEFAKMREWFPNRINVVSEGDSWFAYPKKWIIAGKPANLIDYITRWSRGKTNFLTLASNGDEALDMVSGRQKHRLTKILRWHETGSRIGKSFAPVNVLLFSGGGNDLVGENDFERFLIPYQNDFAAEDCIDVDRLRRKAKQIRYAFEELADIRDHYSPETLIVTHTYDYPYPSSRGPLVLGGLIKTCGWMKKYMDSSEIEIPEPLQADIIRIFMDTVGEEILSAGSGHPRFLVVDTRHTLKGKNYWLNEIHPTSEGFQILAKRMFDEILANVPELRG